MIPEIGHFALILCLALSIVQGVLPLVGAAKGNRALMAVARPAAAANAFFGTVAIGCLAYSFYLSDFTVLNVANNSNSLLPWYYKVAATWGSHEGSILFWTVTLGWWGAAVAFCARRLPAEMVARVTGVLGLVGMGFLLFMLLTSTPFLRLFPAPAEGADLNPLLQDPGMVFHPPLLYLGYVGFAVPFAFAIAALISGRLDAAWARWMRPWTTAAWVLLTLGIALGSYWAYYELGWGGWWFWDPVENSSFMPWLTGTALIHSLAVTEKRGCFRIWTVLLAILTFSLSLLGTFLVRSGVLTSVHAFATDPERGLFILAFLIIVIGLSFLLFAWRAPTVGLGGNFSLISRESMLLVNNVLLVVAMGAVLLGTLYPLFLDALNAGKISVGPPYFDAVFGPLMLPCVFLMGVGPLARWKDADPKALARELAWCLVAAIVAGAAIPLLMGEFGHWVFLGCTSAMFVFFAVIQTFRHQIRNQPGNVFARLMRQPRAFWGMQLAHIGVAVFIIGVALVKGYQSERDVRMYEGETVTVAGYTFTFNGVETVRGPNYTADRGDFTLSVNGRELQHLYPEKRKYYSSNSMPMTESAIRHSITGDVYVSLGTPTNDGGWVVRAYYKPYVTWIWWGCIIMAAAGLWAASDRRYRRRKQKNEADGE
ncbi:cytochrome c-type biogenesis protein CcmF [Sutterella sp. KLE1602]|uniref:heme lyase CcmF/NrfE family subunit n=1 Tax=Sutterella sp. KLE1602 TaxID=1574262 RepID=UPI000780548D|nr:heme lyase CcmF/NrfE family subunit [Sutterella sp. KLE1602]KXT30180.1 cytochrome c-type biogenesis protein CcmF [Sutterella sp. KLE1602]